MVSDAYIKAAKRDGATAVTLMSVESIDALVRKYSTAQDWAGCVDLTGVSTTEKDGVAIQAKTLVATVADSANERLNFSTGPDAHLLAGEVLLRVWWVGGQTSIVSRVRLFDGEWAVFSAAATIVSEGNFSYGGSNSATYQYGTGLFKFPPRAMANISGGWLAGGDSVGVVTGALWFGAQQPVAFCEMATTTLTASLTTATIDLGEVPTEPAQFQVDDVRPANTDIVYTAYAGNVDPPTVNLGTVIDGATLGATGYRYYCFQADFSTTNGDRSDVGEIRVIGGNSQFKHFSNRAGQPIASAIEALKDKALSTLSSKVDLTKFATTGEASVTMDWSREVGDMLATGYLKNKTVYIRSGFVGLPEPDFAVIFSGTWADYTADHKKKTIRVKLQNVLKRISKRQLPEETMDAAGNKTTTPLGWVNVNGIQIMLDMLDLLGVPDREFDRAEFESIRDGARAGWNLSRRIEDPVDAGTLLAELSVTMQVFLSPQPTGLLKPIIYDKNAEAVANLDARDMEFGQIDGGQKKLFTRQKVYYNANTAKPSKHEDYDNVLVFSNDDSEINRNEIAEQEWFDKWGINSTIAFSIADRFDKWFAEPHYSVSVSKVPPHLLGIMPGQIVTVDNLELPVPAAEYGDLSAGAKFLVMARNHDPQTGGLKLDLYDVQATGTPGSGLVGTDMAIAGPEVVSGDSNVFVASAGIPPYTWETTEGVISPIDSTSANLDTYGANGAAGTVSCSDAGGTVIQRFRLAPDPVADFVLINGIAGDWLEWTPTGTAYEIRSGEDWTSGAVVAKGYGNRFDLGPQDLGTYIYFIAAVSEAGDYSTAVSVERIVVAPAAPTGLAATARPESIGLTWSLGANQSELIGTEVWSSDTNDRTAASLVDIALGESYAHALAADTSKYYWVRSINKGSTPSEWHPLSATAGVVGTAASGTGADGADGVDGNDGAPGPDGVSSYFHVAYADDVNGGGFSQIPPGKAYIGTYVDTLVADSTNPALYTWALIKGADGLNGDQGIPGTAGSDGQTSYLHTAYATNSSGTTGFHLSDPTGKTYIGTYVDFLVADSTNPALYTWALIKGADAITVFVSAPSGKQWVQANDGGAWAPAGSALQLDYTWVQGGVDIARSAELFTRDSAGNITNAVTTHTGGDLNAASVVFGGTGWNTPNRTMTGTYLGVSVTETMTAVLGGTKGTTGDNGIDGAAGADGADGTNGSSTFTYYQSWSVDGVPIGASINELWYNTDNDELRRYNGTSWDLVSTVGMTASQVTSFATLSTQVDNKFSVYVQDTPDPQTTWGADPKANHNGDQWYKPTDKKWYIFDGISAWAESDTSVFDLDAFTQTKTSIIYGTTTPTGGQGIEGDYYVKEAGGVITYYKKTGVSTWSLSGSFVDGADNTGTVMNAGVTVSSANGGLYAGKTGYSDNANAGFFLGRDTDGIPKFNIGGVSHSMQWSGTELTLRGNLTADDIQSGGTITGSTLQTSSAGKRFVVDDVTDTAEFYDTDGTTTLISLGLNTIAGESDTVIGAFGGATSTKIGMWAAGIGNHVAIIDNKSSTAGTVGLKANGSTAIAATANVGTGRAVQGVGTTFGGHFTSASQYGIYGETGSATKAYAGVRGRATSGGYGVIGVSSSGAGVYGSSTSAEGVSGVSSTNVGVRGVSASAGGVAGASTNGNGIYGWSTNLNGVAGFSANAVGVRGIGATYDFYAAGAGTNYGPFTGGHDGLILKGSPAVVGDIIVDDLVVAKANVSNTICINDLSSMAKQKSVLGVFVKGVELVDQNALAALKDEYGADWSVNYDHALINAVGEGQINVCKEGGDIQVGDYICSSSTAGKGMKQDDDLLHSYTVAKAREAVIWETGDDDIKMIACTYHCG